MYVFTSAPRSTGRSFKCPHLLLSMGRIELLTSALTTTRRGRSTSTFNRVNDPLILLDSHKLRSTRRSQMSGLELATKSSCAQTEDIFTCNYALYVKTTALLTARARFMFFFCSRMSLLHLLLKKLQSKVAHSPISYGLKERPENA